MRRVVVTGLGLVTPLGADVETTWKNILAGKSGAGPITHFDASDQKCRIACEVKPADHEYGFDPGKRVDHKVQRQVDPFIVYGIDAAGQAIEDAGLTDMPEEMRLRAGVSIGSGIGGLPGIESESLVLAEKGPGRVSPHFVHGRLINLVSGQVSIKYGLMGPNHAVVTACSTGAHSIGDAARMIKDDDADIMLAGGAEATICPIGIAGFAQARALSTAFNDQPEKASRPFSQDRRGFVISEGAGAVILATREFAEAHGLAYTAELAGWGMTSDAHHFVAPHFDTIRQCMQNALADASISPEDIAAINAHAASTRVGDKVEYEALRAIFGAKLPPVSANKSLLGHAMGASSAIETIFALQGMQENILPPTINFKADPEIDIDCVAEGKRSLEQEFLLKNSFGFGGCNACAVFKKVT